MEKAYGYIRVSGQGQIEGDGFTRQEKAIMDYANGANIEVVKNYNEQVSGTKDYEDREVFQQMITDILKNGVNTIIVEGLDRLAREYRIQESILIFLASKDIVLINARTGENITEAITSDPMKKALIQMQGIFSELEKNMLVKKLKIARENIKQETGKCEGQKGYQDINPELIAEVKRLRRKPRNGKRMSQQKICDELNAKGYTTKAGKAWQVNNLKQLIHNYIK